MIQFTTIQCGRNVDKKTNLPGLTTPSNEACATRVSETITDIDVHEIIQNGSTSYE